MSIDACSDILSQRYSRPKNSSKRSYSNSLVMLVDTLLTCLLPTTLKAFLKWILNLHHDLQQLKQVAYHFILNMNATSTGCLIQKHTVLYM